MRRSHRAPQRRATAVHLGQWTQTLRDAEYGRLNKVLEALQSMPYVDRASVSGNVLVRCIERCSTSDGSAPQPCAQPRTNKTTATGTLARQQTGPTSSSRTKP